MGTKRQRPNAPVVFDDIVSTYLEELGMSLTTDALARVVGAVSLAAKQKAKDVNAVKFPITTGAYNKSIWYRQKKKGKSARLFAGQLSAIYEHQGADIYPGAHTKDEAGNFVRSGKIALSSQDNPRATTLFITRGSVHLEPRPWFFTTMRVFEKSALFRAAVERQLEWELKKGRLK